MEKKPHYLKPHIRPRKWLCPVCGKYFKKRFILKKIKSATTDCDNCGALLMVNEGKLYDFHNFLHDQCDAWPADGEGTYSIGF